MGKGQNRSDGGPAGRVIKVGRRICWPDPDEMCLMGGCIHCRDHPIKGNRQIWAFVKDRPNLIPHYQYGLDNPGNIIWWERFQK